MNKQRKQSASSYARMLRRAMAHTVKEAQRSNDSDRHRLQAHYDALQASYSKLGYQ